MKTLCIMCVLYGLCLALAQPGSYSSSSGDDNLGMSGDDEVGMSTDDELGKSGDDELGISNDDQLGISSDDDLGMSCDDELGQSGDDELRMSCDDELGMPCDDELGMSSDDELGILCGDELGLSLRSSLVEKQQTQAAFSSSESEYNLGLSLQSSSSEDETGIPLGQSGSEDSFGEETVSVSVEMDLENVRAKPVAARKISDYLLSEVSSGKVMKRKALSILSVKSALKEKCLCGLNCIRKMDFKTIRSLRESFWINSKTVRMHLLKCYISNSENCGRWRFLTINTGIRMCSRAFQIVLKVNKNTFSRALDLHRRHMSTVTTKKPRDISDHTLLLMIWLEEYSSYHGDRMPDSNIVLLPYKTKKNILFQKYKTEMENKAVSRSQFFKIWDVRFPHLKIKKTNSFSKCSVCTTLERQLEKTTDPITRASYRQLKDEHNERQMLERKYYYAKREASRNNPSKFMSLIVDGMDQSKTNLPHFAGRRAKSVNAADLLKTHVTGVINHGHGGFHSYIDINEYPHDPNLTINVILKTLKDVADRQKFLPPTLYIQADNCFRENKNRFVLAMCEMLVAERVFDEVHISFLFVGHTHEDVDAAFSKVAENLRKSDAETFDNLLKLIPNSEVIEYMFDVKKWIIPNLNKVKKISDPLHYKFSFIDNQVKIQYKGQHNDIWKHLDGNILTSIPTGKPELLSPNYDEINNGKQLKQCEQVKHMFVNQHSIEVWRQFYSDIKDGKRMPPRNVEWILDVLPRQTRLDEEEIIISDEVEKMMEKEKQIPEVRIQKKQLNRQKTKASGVNQKKSKNSRKNKQDQRQQQNTKGKANKQGQAGRRSKQRSHTRLVKCNIQIQQLEEEKKHIWWRILVDLLDKLFHVFLIFVMWFYLRTLDIMAFLSSVNCLLYSIIMAHIGYNFACVNLYNYYLLSAIKVGNIFCSCYPVIFSSCYPVLHRLII